MPSWQGVTVARTRAAVGARLGWPKVSQFSATTACCDNVRAARLKRHLSRARPDRESGGGAREGAGGHGQGSRGGGSKGYEPPRSDAQREVRVKEASVHREPIPT